MIVGSGPVRRPFALNRLNLSGHWLVGEDFRGADLGGAGLLGAAGPTKKQLGLQSKRGDWPGMLIEIQSVAVVGG
jgi:hypothetical protein